MSSEYEAIVVAIKEMTSELVKELLETEFSDTSEEYIVDSLSRQNDKRIEEGNPTIDIPDSLLERMIQYQSWRQNGTLVFSGETTADDHIGEEACQILRNAGITYEFYLANDETDADETIWSPTFCVKYDVSKEGDPIIPLQEMEEALSGGTDREKLEKVEALFRKRSAYGLMTPQKIAEANASRLSDIDQVLVQLDAGAITHSDAMEMIKEIKLKGA